MAAPLEIKALRRVRVGPAHPLDFDLSDEDTMDSSVDSSYTMDSSYNESIASVALADSPCTCLAYSSGCARAPVAAVVLPVPVTVKHPPQGNTVSQLSRLMRPKERPWRWNYFTPRATDDKIPPRRRAPDQELVTFALRAPAHAALARSRQRTRECRINSVFLRRYALDCAARSQRLLPSTRADVAALVRRPALRRFDAAHGLLRVLALARDKLGELVVLPPRTDAVPGRAVSYERYTYVGGAGGSVTSKTGNYIPWAAHRPLMKPAGVLRTAGGPTPAQYTIKGWCNERWA